MPTEELRAAPDEVLARSLQMLFDQHEHAADNNDKQACAEIHYGIVQIINEQARRTDEWIAAKQCAE